MDDLTAEIIRCGAFLEGDFTLASGRKSSYYVDIKKAYTDPRILKTISRCISEKIDPGNFDSVSGIELGSVPIAVAVSIETKLPLLIVRKESKSYGTGDRVIGSRKEDMKILLIEDVTTTGGSVLDAVEVLREAGCAVDSVIVVVDREEGASENLQKHGVELVALLKVSELGK